MQCHWEKQAHSAHRPRYQRPSTTILKSSTNYHHHQLSSSRSLLLLVVVVVVSAAGCGGDGEHLYAPASCGVM